MALHSPFPHPWCWFCHSFGRFNCFLFHILQQRHDAVGTVRQPGQVPLYLRQSNRSYVVSTQPADNWSYQQPSQPPPTTPPPLQMQPQQQDESYPGASSKPGDNIGFYEIEIRPNVKNVPADLNRYIPYRIHTSPRQDSSTDSSSCDSPMSDFADEMGQKFRWEPAPRARKPRKK